ncbi:MAG: hypothetical protein AAF570_13035 [Bacteroidota bacterium]
MKYYFVNPLVKLSALFALIIMVSSCQKEELATEEPVAAQSLGDAENLMDDANDEATYRTAPDYSGTDCPVITYANPQGTFPNTITLDFGDGCEGRNGRIKSGQIIVEISAPYDTEGSVRSITPVNFFVNDWQIEGQRTVTNMGYDENGFMHWNVVVENAKVTNPDGEFATWNANRTRTLIEGGDTETCEDNVYEITGGSTGISRKGVAFTATITTPLIKPMSCRWPVSGVREVTADGGTGFRIYDMGDGTCDNKATVTFANGTVKEITLRR